jgi:hypothetical protein
VRWPEVPRIPWRGEGFTHGSFNFLQNMCRDAPVVVRFKTHLFSELISARALGICQQHPGLQKIKANRRKDQFQVLQKCFHICAIRFTQASAIRRRLIAIVAPVQQLSCAERFCFSVREKIFS